VIIDQFISAGSAKWGQNSRLVLLPPPGYEGQGPEHSSARLERYLQLAGLGAMTVVDCTPPAPYLHLPLLQAPPSALTPLPVFAPKSLLRHPRAVSMLDELTAGAFHPVLDDPEAADRRNEVTRVILCTGKVYYDLITAEARAAARNIAIVRVERLYPFPAEEI